MEAQGFPDKWSRWMKLLLSTSKLAVLVNGVPSPWIQCRRGLRQGDALSPYLSLLVADVLQILIKTDRGVRHPMADRPCPVLQYADDIIILALGSGRDRGCHKVKTPAPDVLHGYWARDQLREEHCHPNVPA